MSTGEGGVNDDRMLLSVSGTDDLPMHAAGPPPLFRIVFLREIHS